MEPRRRLKDGHHMLIMCLVLAVVGGGLAYLFLHIDFIANPASEAHGMKTIPPDMMEKVKKAIKK